MNSANAQYARHEPAFLARHESAVRKGLAYCEEHTRDGLIWQNDHEDWLDVFGRQGQVLYTNVLYYASLGALAKAFRHRDRRMAADLLRKARSGGVTILDTRPSHEYDAGHAFNRDDDKSFHAGCAKIAWSRTLEFYAKTLR